MKTSVFISVASATSGRTHAQARSQALHSPRAPPQHSEPHVARKAMSRRHFSAMLFAASTAGILPAEWSNAECCDSPPDRSALGDFLQRNFALCMDVGMTGYEAGMCATKRELFSMIPSGSTIADIGIGTAPNIEYYPTGARIIGIEPNEFMWTYAEKNRTLKNPSLQLELRHGTSEQVPLESNSCDVVVTTLTLCSVANVQSSLQEIERVLKPNGMFIFIEHVIAPETQPLLRLSQVLLTPLQQAISDGCHFDRDTGKYIEEAFRGKCKEIEVRHFAADVDIPFIKPHIAGFVQLL